MMAQHDGEEFEGNWYKVAEEPEVLKDGVVYGNPDMIEMRAGCAPPF
jgi:lipocalin